jgi:hypothetical protein
MGSLTPRAGLGATHRVRQRLSTAGRIGPTSRLLASTIGNVPGRRRPASANGIVRPGMGSRLRAWHSDRAIAGRSRDRVVANAIVGSHPALRRKQSPGHANADASLAAIPTALRLPCEGPSSGRKHRYRGVARAQFGSPRGPASRRIPDPAELIRRSSASICRGCRAPCCRADRNGPCRERIAVPTRARHRRRGCHIADLLPRPARPHQLLLDVGKDGA